MSWDFCTNEIRTARKEYYCDACEWIENQDAREEFGEEDLAIWEKAKSEKCRIRKGTKYIINKGKYEGDWSVFRARPEIDELCQKYNVYWGGVK